MSPCCGHALYMLRTNFMSRPFLTMVSFVHRAGMYISTGFSTPSLHARVRIPHQTMFVHFVYRGTLTACIAWVVQQEMRMWGIGWNCNYRRYCALVYMHERCHLLMLHVAQRIIEQGNDIFFSVLHFDWKTLLGGDMALCFPVSLAVSARSIEKRQNLKCHRKLKSLVL